MIPGKRSNTPSQRNSTPVFNFSRSLDKTYFTLAITLSIVYHAADRELASAERYYRPASPAMKKLIAMVMETAKAGSVPVTICGLAVGNPVNTVQYLQMGLRSFSVSPQNLLHTKKALLEADAHPDDTELE